MRGGGGQNFAIKYEIHAIAIGFMSLFVKTHRPTGHRDLTPPKIERSIVVEESASCRGNACDENDEECNVDDDDDDDGNQRQKDKAARSCNRGWLTRSFALLYH